MKESSSDRVTGTEGGTCEPTPIGWRRSLGLAFLLWLAYMVNLNTLGAGDTTGASLLPVAVIRGDGVFLDRFERLIRDGRGSWRVISPAGGAMSCRCTRSRPA